MRPRHPGFGGLALVSVLASTLGAGACGGGPRPSTHAQHAPLLMPPPEVGAIALEVPNVHRFVLGRGTIVHVVQREQALGSHVAVAGDPRALVGYPRVAADRVIARMLGDAFDADARLERTGLRVSRDAGLDQAVVLAATLLTLEDEPRLTPSGVFRASTTLGQELGSAARQLDDSRARRFYGPNSLEWELASSTQRFPQPSVQEVRDRLAVLLGASTTQVVIIGPEAPELVASRLEALLAAEEDDGVDPSTDLATPVALFVTEPSVTEPRPQLHAIARETPVAMVRMTAMGPDPYADAAAHFELAMRLVAGSHRTPVFRALRLEGESYMVRGRVERTVGALRGLIEISVRPSEVARAVSLVLEELERLTQTANLDEGALAVARRLELAEEVAGLERAGDLAASILDASVAGHTLAVHAQRFQSFATATSADIARVAASHLAPGRVAIDVVAPADALSALPVVPGGQEITRR